MHELRRLARCLFTFVLGLRVDVAADEIARSLRGNATFTQEIELFDDSPRRLTACNGFWLITCSSGSCTPSCTYGYTADSGQPTCALATNPSWQAPECVPWTEAVEARGEATWSVDNAYTLEIYALRYENTNVVSLTENRNVVATLNGSSSSALTQYTVAIVLGTGIGTQVLTHTTAENVTVLLSGSDYGAHVDFISKSIEFTPGAITQYVFVHSSLTGTVDSPIAVEIEARDQYGNVCTGETRGIQIKWSASSSDVLLLSTLSGGKASGLVSKTVPGTYTVQFVDVNGVGATHSDTMTVIFGVGSTTKYVIVPPNPSSYVAGTSVSVSVEAKDQYDNLVTSEQNDVRLVASSSASLSPSTGDVPTVNGVGAVSVTHTVAETISLSLQDFQATGKDVSSTASLTFTPAAPARVEVTASPSTGTVDAALSVEIRAYDQYNNHATTSSSFGITVTVSPSADVTQPDGASRTVTNGYITHSIKSEKMQNVVVGLSDSSGLSLNVASTVTLTFNAGVPTKVALSAAAFGTTDGPVTLTLNAKDQYDNFASTATSSFTLQASGTGSIPYSGAVTLSSGQATTTLSATSVGAVTVTILDSSSTGWDITSTVSVTFSPGSTSKYAIVPPNPSSNVAGTSVTVTVQAQDQYNNRVTAEQTDVRLVASNSAVLTPSNGNVDIINGEGTISVEHTVAEIISLSLQDFQATGKDVSSTTSLTFTPAAPSRIALAASPASGTVDAALSVEIRAYDQYNNLATASSPQVTVVLSASLGNVFQPDGAVRTVTNGYITHSVQSHKIQSVSVSIIDSSGLSLNVASATVALSFTAGSPAKVVLSAPASGTTDAPVTVTLRSKDQYDNLAPSGTSSFTLQASGTGTVANNGAITLSSGDATTTVSATGIGAVSVTILDSSSTGWGITSTVSIMFASGPASRYVLQYHNSVTQASVSDSIQVDVFAWDQYGNVATSENRDVTVASSGTVSNNGLVNIANGYGSALVSNTVATQTSVTLTDSGGTGLDVSSSLSLQFIAGPGHRVTIVKDSLQGTVDAGWQITLWAYDIHNNIALSESRQIQVVATGSVVAISTSRRLSSNSSAMVADANPETPLEDRRLNANSLMTFSQGSATASITSQKAEGVTVSLVDSAGTGMDVASTLTLPFSSGAPNKVVVSALASGTVGGAVTATVTAKDQYNNVATSVALSFTVQSSGSGQVSNGGSVLLSNGVGTIIVSNQVAEQIQLSLVDSSGTGFDVTSTTSITWNPEVANRYVLQYRNLISQGTVDNPISVDVLAQDQYGNLATSAQNNIGVITDVTGATTETVSITNGAGIASISHTMPGIVTVSLVDVASTGLQATSQLALTFLPGAAHDIELAASVTSSTVDSPLTVTLRAVDQYGNLATAEAGTVELRGNTLTSLGSANFTSGQASKQISWTTPGIVVVSWLDSFGIGLNHNPNAILQLQFTPGAIHHFSLVDGTGATYAIRKFGKSVDVTIKVEDQYNNLVSDAPSLNVDAILEPTPTGFQDDGLLNVTHGNGSYQFSLNTTGIFQFRIADAWDVTLGGPTALLTAAVSRSTALTADYRQDLIPPAYSSINATGVATNSFTVGVVGISERSQIWCIATNVSAPAPVTPTSISDGAVFAALRGPNGQSLVSPQAKSSDWVSSWAQMDMTGLQTETSYALRCAIADEDRNQMSGAVIYSHQLIVTTASPVATTETATGLTSTTTLSGGGSATSGSSGDSDDGSDISLVIGIAATVVVLLCCCLVGVGFKYRVLRQERDNFEKIVPESPKEEPAAELKKAINSVPDTVEDDGGLKRGSVVSTTIAPSEDSEEIVDVSPAPGQSDEDSELLREALELEQELMDELGKRGTMDTDWFDSESEDSDTEAVLRDVKVFLHHETSAALSEEIAIELPDLPLGLTSEEEARIDALIALGQQNLWWEDRCRNFDDLWKDVDGLWVETKRVARAEQEKFHKETDSTIRQQLRDAEEALASLPENQAASLLDELAAEDESFVKLTNQVLSELHNLTVDWPEEDAKLREALIEEWTERIVEASKMAEKQTVRKDAVTALRELDDKREDDLEARLEAFEDKTIAQFQKLRDKCIKHWRGVCDKLEAEAKDKRNEVARLKLALSNHAWRAEEAALVAALQLRKKLRDAVVESEAERESSEREEEYARFRKNILAELKGDDPEVVTSRNRALHVLDRVVKDARKVASEQTERRKGHWHEILQERSRERIKAARRRFQEEERRLADAAANVEEDGHDADDLRRSGLTLGSTHRSEAAILNVTAAARRGRILMGLQATAAGSVAEERLPKRLAGGRLSVAEEGSGKESAVPSGEDFGSTGMRWQAAKRKAADELNDAIGMVASALAHHGQTQRLHLTQRQNREAYLARQPESEDQKVEDLLDALEENMHREIRVERWRELAVDAEALVHRSCGEETELGRRLAAVARDSELLTKEDLIGEKYDRLRAYVLRGGNMGAMEEITAAQEQASELEAEAAKLRGSMEEDSDDDGESPLSKLDQLEGRRAQRQRGREEARKRAEALRKEGKEDEAAAVLAAALRDEMIASDVDEDERARLRALLGGAEGDLDDEAEKQRLRREARRAERQSRRKAAIRKAATGFTGGATFDSMLGALVDAGTMSDDDASLTQDKLKDELRKNMENADGMLADEAEAQRLKLEARRARRAEARKRKLEEAAELESQGQNQDALEVLDSLLKDELAGSNDDWLEDRNSDPSVTEADHARFKDLLSEDLDALADMTKDESETQLLRMEARRAQRQKRREDARRRAKELAEEGKTDEAVALLNSVVGDAGNDSDSDWKKNKGRREQFDASVSDAERERLRMRLVADMDQASDALANDDEAQRLKFEAKRAARQKRRDAARQQAQELAEQGRDEEALEVIKDAMAIEISESETAWNTEEGMTERKPFEIGVCDADRDKLKDQLANQEHIDDESEAQRLKMASRRAERQKRREEAQKKAQEAAANGDTKEAIDIMAAVLDDEGSTSDTDFEQRRAARKPIDLTITDAARSKLKSNLDHAQEVFGDESEAQRLKNEERRAIRQKRREEAKAKAAKLEKEAAELRANMALPGELVKKGSSGDLDLLSQWQEDTRQRAAKGILADAAQGGMETAARRILDSSVDDDDRSALKDAFAKEMEHCQDMVADEREAQKHKAQERLEARRRRRAEAKKQDQVVKAKTRAKMLWTKTHDVFGGVKQIKKNHERNLTKKLLEHADIERRVRAECEAEFKALEAKLREKADDEIARLKAKLKNREEQRTVKEVKEGDMQKAREAGVALAAEAENLIETEKQKQAAKIEKRLADRKKRLQKREADTRQGHAQEEVRIELDHEREKLHAKPIEQKKSKALVKELYKVKSLISKLQNPADSNSTEHRALTIAAVASLQPTVGNAVSGRMSPPQPPLSTIRSSGALSNRAQENRFQPTVALSEGRVVSGSLRGSGRLAASEDEV